MSYQSTTHRSHRPRGIPHTATRTAFLLGGIGTGNVSLGARGELRDWELENLPNKGRTNPYSFFAIHVAHTGGTSITRVLEATSTGPYDGDSGHGGFGQVMGLPRLDGSTMYGEYPVVDIDFHDKKLPVEVSLKAFTPLVPLDPNDSGIPATVLRYRVFNPQQVPVRVSIAGSLTHAAGHASHAMQRVRWREENGVRGLDFDIDLPENDLGYGTMSLTTTDTQVTAKPQWLTGFWPDGVRLFWNDFAADGLLEPETRFTLDTQSIEPSEQDTIIDQEELQKRLPHQRTGTLGIVHELAPSQVADFEFVLSWSFPNRPKRWLVHRDQITQNEQIVKNHYATLWADSFAAASYLHKNLTQLEKTTLDFTEALYGGSLDPVIADAVGANIAALRSTTCFVVKNPNPALGVGSIFAAWEGSFDQSGSCHGTCTHVWSYAQTVAWLFPTLERSARRVEFLLETDEKGAQQIRSNKIFGEPSWGMGSAVDGQLGSFIRLHREWRFCGDDDFLRECWPGAVRTLDYAIREWDRDGDGLLDGKLHNTYDIEFRGIEPLANGMFLTALTAGVRLAEHLGERERADAWRSQAKAVSTGMEQLLWNGEWYRQIIDDVDTYRYQYGEGVLSDQLLGQFHAYLNGFGEILPREHVRSALGAIFRHNFRSTFREHESTQRVYALGDEGGLLLGSWPGVPRPEIPMIYADEVWTGIEHQVAASLIYAGLPEEALTIERALRGRYTGETRSPWNEIECGHHYARSLASWALLLAYSGAQWDAPSRTLSFDPRHDGSYLFTTATGWGHVQIEKNKVTLHLSGGTLEINRLILRGNYTAENLHLNAGESHTCTIIKTSTERP